MARKPKKSEQASADAVEVKTASASTEAADEMDVLVDDGFEYLQCGEALYNARTEQGLSTQEAANQLRLSQKQIEALEQDDFASLPEATIVKGFIRNYAKLLKIPAEPLLTAYVQMMPEKEDYSFALKPGINMKITENNKSHKMGYFLAAVAALILGGVWFFYQSYVQKPSPVNPMPEIAEALPELDLPMTEQIEDTSITQLAIPEQQKELPAVTTETTSVSEAITDEVEIKATESSEQPKPALEDQRGELVAEEPPPVVSGKTRLEFSATQETWLSVVNTSGREVYNKILYAGDRDVVDISQPAEIVVGNAHGATLVVDGKAVDLAPYTRINVARYRFR